jgi:acetyl-CoA carboxylase biotin carboxyl carrier protein
VRIGDRVTPTTVVGILEAMKVMNDIQADCSGVIVEALVQNEQPIEFDTVLFRVDPGA